MTLVLDTSGLYAALNPRERAHEPCRATLEGADGPFVLSPFVLAELDDLLLTRAGAAVELAFLDEVAAGAYTLAPFASSDVALARTHARRHRELQLGLADASLLVLCERYDTTNVLTLDHRHFRSVTPANGALRLLPADGQPA